MIHRLAETTSTNDEAKRGARSGAEHGTVWVADAQTAGRGRQGRVWQSAPGENLLCSVLMRLEGPPANLPLVGLAAGLAVCDAIDRAKVKWPNDVLVGGKKIAGILGETADGALVMGIGINVLSHPPNVNATSLKAEGQSVDKDALLERVVSSLLRDAPLVAARGIAPIHARLGEADALRGRHVRTDEGIEGIAEGIDEEGRLIVGSHRLAYGEVHLSAR
jgi:BirA family biotin operon repressor/biotin-[acetyl-CoA-carboxylase] ligase